MKGFRCVDCELRATRMIDFDWFCDKCGWTYLCAVVDQIAI